MAFEPSNPEVIDDYLAGRLSEENLDLFEEALLSDVDLQAAVFAQKELKLGLQDISEEILVPQLPSILQRINGMIATAYWGYATTVILLIALSWNLLDNAVAPSSNLVAGPVDSIVYAEQLRSSSTSTISIRPNNSTLISFDVADLNADPISFKLYQGSNLRMEISNLTPNSERSIHILLPQLETGQYSIELNDQNTALNFLLDVGL